MIENLKKKKQLIKTKTSNKGITLIALVITIIVLLILAGVTIAMLTGENGILTQAENAKKNTTKAELMEKIQLEMLASIGNDGKYDVETAKQNLKDNLGLTEESGNVVDNGDGTLKVRQNGYEFLITEKGKVEDLNKGGSSEGKTLASLIESGEKVTKNTPVEDTYGNLITIPKGFKIASDSATDVTGGIVIEDATYTNTKGSQFVWIPVAEKIYKNKEQTEFEEITLGRYMFDSSGNIDTTLSASGPSPSDRVATSSYTEFYFIEKLKDQATNNAKDIEVFIDSVNDNHGYYIGRFEARKSSAGNLTVVGTDSVYSSITQSDAATASRNMYDEDLTFTSDLINSYAWDTAIIFEQKFDNRTTGKTTPYSRQTSLNAGSIATTGTNNLTDTTKQDKICNIWDMASNCYEWTTEYINDYDNFRYCVFRGNYTSKRGNSEDSGRDKISFRPLLYL